MALPMRRGGAGLERRMSPWGTWDPFGDFENVWSEMGRLLGATAPTAVTRAPGAWMPMAEEEEIEDAYLIRAELPGIPAENVDIAVEGNDLSITGELTEEKRGKSLNRRTGKFSYRTMLPADADSEKVDADLTDGVLTVRVPKTEGGKRRRIEIGSRRQITGETA
jgi:HSP20 family protein